MKDYNFISDDRLHKTRFCKKKGGLTKMFLTKRGVGAKGGGLNDFIFSGGMWPKRGGDFSRGRGWGGSYPGALYVNNIKKLNQ